MATEYSGEVVRLALVAGDEAAIRDHNFSDCDIHGPAVLFPARDTTFSHCSWDGTPDHIVWRLAPEQEAVVGAILMERCQFVGCRLHKVGLAPPPDQAAAMLRQMTG
jgi:hypothetical protein